MAYDKLVDSAALEANLTTIANAIREKAGTSDALAFPEGFAEAIAGISAGGGDLAFNCGAFMYSTYPGTATHQFEHGLSVRPRIYGVMACASSSFSRNNTQKVLVSLCSSYSNAFGSNATSVVVYAIEFSTTKEMFIERASNNELSSIYGISADNQYIKFDMTNSGIYIVNAQRYYWFAIADAIL